MAFVKYIGNRNNPFVESYNNYGYFLLSDAVNSFISTKACVALTNGCQNELTDGVLLKMAGPVPFPNQSISTLSFWSAIGSAFALLMVPRTHHLLTLY